MQSADGRRGVDCSRLRLVQVRVSDNLQRSSNVRIRVEIYVASRLLNREGHPTFSLQDLLQRVLTEFGDARHGVMSFASGQCVANAESKLPGVKNYLWRLNQGLYRCFDPQDDVPDPSRVHAPVRPDASDVPEPYRFLLEIDDVDTEPSVESLRPPDAVTPDRFEWLARRVMSQQLGASLSPGMVQHILKRWDLVSADGRIVGDAKYYTLVHGEALPPAKLSAIAEHVWLLEKTGADIPFLVFGNDRRVPQQWLERYGHLAGSVQFYFLSDDGELQPLN